MAIYNGTALTELPVYGMDRLGTYTLASNSYVYELKDNVGSVRVVLNGSKNGDGTANVVQYNDYYPYGSIARSGGTGYRYDYQGAYAEKDPVTGWNNFELRMYDGRVGRWLSIDPAGQFASSYEGMGNNPVIGNDPTGGEDYPDEASANFARFAAWLSGENPGDVYNSGGSDGNGWGFNTISSDGRIVANFGSKDQTVVNMVWNSAPARYIIPDIITVGGGFTGIAGVGAGTSFELNLVTRGKHPFTFVPTTTISVGGGFSIDATLNIGRSYYTGNIRNLDPSMLQTDSRKGDLPALWVSGGLTAGGKVGVTGSISKVGTAAIISATMNIGAGLPTGPLPLNGAGGVSNTIIIGGQYKQ